MSEASPEFATAAWLLEDSHFPYQALCRGIAHVSSVTNDVNAYRAELQGLHALLLAVKAVCSFHLITSGSILIGCDNVGAPKPSNSRNSPPVALPMPTSFGPSATSAASSPGLQSTSNMLKGIKMMAAWLPLCHRLLNSTSMLTSWQRRPSSAYCSTVSTGWAPWWVTNGHYLSTNKQSHQTPTRVSFGIWATRLPSSIWSLRRITSPQWASL